MKDVVLINWRIGLLNVHLVSFALMKWISRCDREISSHRRSGPPLLFSIPPNNTIVRQEEGHGNGIVLL